jgi:YD repeat-containing protein
MRVNDPATGGSTGMQSDVPHRVSPLRAAGLIAWLAGWTLLVASACPPTGVVYVYDENERLVGVEESSQGARVYAYDAAGNITGITSYAANKVLVLSFSPPCGEAGTSLTVNGIGFDSTATVTFARSGGTVGAPVSSVSFSRLVTTIPANAITGPVTVSVGADSHSRVLTVGCGLPTLTSVSPQLVAPGDTVTLTGTNFSPATADDFITINALRVHPTTATPTQLTVAAPSTGSGRVRVSTPFGVTANAIDLYVAPPEVPTANIDVGASTRMSIGQTKTINLSVINRVVLVLVDGIPGRRFAATVGFGTAWAHGDLYDPYASWISSDNAYAGASAFLESVLPADGATYTVAVRPVDTTGQATVTINDIRPDFTAMIPVDGSISVPIDDPGQNALVTFNGTANRRASLRVDGNPGCSAADVYVMRPDPDPTILEWGCSFLEPWLMPVSGSYRITVDPYGSTTGQFGLTLFDVADDIVAPVAINGTVVDITLSTPGQNATLSVAPFATPSSRPVTVRVTNNEFTANSCMSLNLRKADGTQVGSLGPPGTCSQAFNMSSTLLANTSYVLKVDPALWNTGRISVQITSP